MDVGVHGVWAVHLRTPIFCREQSRWTKSNSHQDYPAVCKAEVFVKIHKVSSIGFSPSACCIWTEPVPTERLALCAWTTQSTAGKSTPKQRTKRHGLGARGCWPLPTHQGSTCCLICFKSKISTAHEFGGDVIQIQQKTWLIEWVLPILQSAS